MQKGSKCPLYRRRPIHWYVCAPRRIVRWVDARKSYHRSYSQGSLPACAAARANLHECQMCPRTAVLQLVSEMKVDCMDIDAEALRISPKYTSADWDALSIGTPSDWSHAADIVRDRLEGRFLKFVNSWLCDPFSGFIVLAVDSLLAETIEQFRAGETEGKGKSQYYIEQFLSGQRFQPQFDEDARRSFYVDIRCGLLHQAEAKNMWRVRRGQKEMLRKLTEANGYIIDVERFHRAVQQTLQEYYVEIVDPSQKTLRANLWQKMDHISRIRTARGLLYEA